MADITEVNSSETVKIVGSDAQGLEQTPIMSNGSGKLETSNVSNNGGVHGTLIVGTTAVELKVGASALVDRISAGLTNTSNTTIYFGYDNTVTTSTGRPIVKNQSADWDVGPNTTIFLIAGSTNNTIRISENA